MRAAGGHYPGFRVSFQFRLVRMRGAAAGDREGESHPHWPRTLWLSTFTSLRSGLSVPFDLHGWPTSDMNVQARTYDELLAPYRFGESRGGCDTVAGARINGGPRPLVGTCSLSTVVAGWPAIVRGQPVLCCNSSCPRLAAYHRTSVPAATSCTPMPTVEK
jgi:hypothetical protein